MAQSFGGALRVEAAFFLLVLLTFAAVLGQESVTSRSLDLSPYSDQYVPYTYSDANQGGASTVTPQARRPLSWDCTLTPGYEYPYCAYGMQLVLAANSKGVDFSTFKEIALHLRYQGEGDRLKLILKTRTPAALRAKVGEDTMARAVDIDVKPGLNDIHLRITDMHPESWWVASKNLTPEEADFSLDDVVAIDVMANSQTHRRFQVEIESLTFRGAYLSTAQWYLVILGAWLLAAGGFLVYRFLDLRRRYEARQQRQSEEKARLAAAHAAAESASAAKSQFLANMSHELRTPLNAILGYAQLLKNTQLDESQSAAVRTIYSSGDHLLQLITDILDVAKVEAGKLEILTERTDLHACLSDVTEMVRLRAEEKGLRFDVEIEESTPRWVMADTKRVRQVLLNLLGNAIKFTPEGSVRLVAQGVSTAQTVTRVRFTVADTGLGIASDQIERLFRPFEQAGNAIDRSGGTGLGLSITKRLVETMDGVIDVESELAVGSRFRIELPLALAEALSERPVGDKPESPSERTVLVVDDNTTNRRLLRAALELQGHSVVEAANGDEAIEQMGRGRPDLVLMDLRMPVLGGLDAIRHLRAREHTRDVPIVVITANPSVEAGSAAREAGADALMGKPVDLEALQKLMATLDQTKSPTHGSVRTPAPAEHMQHLLALARSGNLRAIRREVTAIRELGPQYHSFADHLDQLAAGYQSPAVLRLIESYSAESNAA